MGRRVRRGIAGVLAALGLVGLAGCGDPFAGGAEGGPSGEIVIGASDVSEGMLLAQIYAGALRAAGAADVTVRPPVGGREVVFRALQDRSLTLVPDYSGNLLRYLDTGAQATTPADVYAQLQRRLPPTMQALAPSPAQDTDQLVVRSDVARSGVRTVSDLARQCPRLVFGGPGQWAERWQQKIKQVYGCEFREIRKTDTGGPVTVAALREGEIDVADLFSTSSNIAGNGFVPLVDDRQMFPAQNVLPLAARGSLTPAEQRALDAVSAALTTDELTRLNVEYTEQKRNPKDIAEGFLAAHGLAR